MSLLLLVDPLTAIESCRRIRCPRCSRSIGPSRYKAGSCPPIATLRFVLAVGRRPVRGAGIDLCFRLRLCSACSYAWPWPRSPNPHRACRDACTTTSPALGGQAGRRPAGGRQHTDSNARFGGEVEWTRAGQRFFGSILGRSRTALCIADHRLSSPVLISGSYAGTLRRSASCGMREY